MDEPATNARLVRPHSPLMARAVNLEQWCPKTTGALGQCAESGASRRNQHVNVAQENRNRNGEGFHVKRSLADTPCLATASFWITMQHESPAKPGGPELLRGS
jgi:hypothetical protein